MDVEGAPGYGLAVYASDVTYRFGGVNGISILDGANIRVGRGHIYGLLGPSGCGKTTLLQCIVGHYRPSSGTIRVCGKVPGQKDFNIPGPGVGFMPQELALYPEITAEETLTFFGRIYQMDTGIIEERIAFLVEFLDIPDRKRQIKHLSGGQQRRVSFAAALVHSPPLLILDEPTVGVDPLLRKKIWNYLKTLAIQCGTTIVITTHYIEEAKQAHTVGLMRSGRLLIETNPQALIAHYRVSTLEDAFLKLCKNDGDMPMANNAEVLAVQETYRKLQESPINLKLENGFKDSQTVAFEEDDVRRRSVEGPKVHLRCENTWAATCGRLSALIGKNIIRYRRNLPLLFAQLFLPTITVIICCLSIGGEPYDLAVAVANMEADPTAFGGSFLRHVDPHFIVQKPYSNLSDALHSVRKGKAWGAVYISPQFTESLTERFSNGADVDNKTIDESTIKLYLDFTNRQISATLFQKFAISFQKFAETTLISMSMNPRLATPPITLNEPVYSSIDSSFTEFMAPAMICSISYLSAIGITAITVIVEKKEGLLNRSIIAGVREWEIILSHFLVLLMIGIVQTVLNIVSVLVIVQVPCLGSYLWVVIGVLLVVMEGMSFGLLIAAITNNENIAILIILGTFFPIINLSGVVWSFEALPQHFRYVSYGLPLTLICKTMRSVMLRGWSIADNGIWDGYVSALLWIFPVILLSGFVSKLKK